MVSGISELIEKLIFIQPYNTYNYRVNLNAKIIYLFFWTSQSININVARVANERANLALLL